MKLLLCRETFFFFLNLYFFPQKKESECLQLKILVLRNELERQKKALGQEVALLHKQKSTLLDRGKCRNLSLVYDQNENAGFFSIFIVWL